MKTGLYLGKFAPFHNGHAFVISSALKQVDHLIVFIYEAKSLTSVSLSQRARWIREIFPTVEVIECPDGPTFVSYELTGMRDHESYIGKTLGQRKISHFFSSEPYGAHMSNYLGAQNVQIDSMRKVVPISASQIREDIFEYRNFLPSRVYFDHLFKIAFVGAPSTGKSTLAEALAIKFSTNYMPEYGREYWEKNQTDHRLTLKQLVELVETHQKLEYETALTCKKIMFVDTTALTTYIFSRYYHQSSESQLNQLADLSRNRYELTVLCDSDIPFDDTEDRSGPASRNIIQIMTIQELHARGIEYILASGNLIERVSTVTRAIEERIGSM